jgi:hypothetical protein
VNGTARSFSTAPAWRQFAWTAVVAGTLFGLFEGFRRGWVDGLIGGVLFGLLLGAISTGRRRRTRWLISRYTSRAGIRYEDLSKLGTKIRDGVPPGSADEADALQRFVDYRRRSSARLPWMFLAMMLPLFVLGGVAVALGAILAGVLLLILSSVFVFLVLLTRWREPGRLDRMDTLLAEYAGSSRNKTDGSNAPDD